MAIDFRGAAPCALRCSRCWRSRWCAGARAEDAPPAAAGRRPRRASSHRRQNGRAGGRGNAPASPAAAEQHRLPPDSTTKQTLALPGRTLAFTATAGSIRLFDDKGEPQADIAYTAYQLDGADPRHPAGDLPVQWRAGRGLRLSATRRCRTVAAADRRRCGGCPRRRPICSPTPRPGSTSPISSSSIPSAPATAASSRPARTCASGSSRSTATSIRSR